MHLKDLGQSSDGRFNQFLNLRNGSFLLFVTSPHKQGQASNLQPHHHQLGRKQLRNTTATQLNALSRARDRQTANVSGTRMSLLTFLRLRDVRNEVVAVRERRRIGLAYILSWSGRDAGRQVCACVFPRICRGTRSVQCIPPFGFTRLLFLSRMHTKGRDWVGNPTRRYATHSLARLPLSFQLLANEGKKSQMTIRYSKKPELMKPHNLTTPKPHSNY